MIKPTLRWGIEWYSLNRLDGETRHIIWENCMPLLFHTRLSARLFIKERFGYIRGRKDLREEPHGWRMPRAVRVKVLIQTAAREDG